MTPQLPPFALQFVFCVPSQHSKTVGGQTVESSTGLCGALAVAPRRRTVTIDAMNVAKKAFIASPIDCCWPDGLRPENMKRRRRAFRKS
jgi:hypothetical protein